MSTDLEPQPPDLSGSSVRFRPVSPVNPVLDVRVQEQRPPAEPTEPWQTSVSLQDLLGGSLVTYDEYINPLQDDPIQPKAIYVRYNSFDPVTTEPAQLVVPAEMTLDCYADPWMFWEPVEEEEQVEEKSDGEEVEDRRKLRSNIRGDPILKRAKPPQPPEPYAVPFRYEGICNEALRSQSVPSSPATWRRAKQVPILRQAGAGAHRDASGAIITSTSTDEQHEPSTAREASASWDKTGGWGPHDASTDRRFFSRSVEATSTMSSYLKSSGRDKYSRSRLREIDRISSRQVVLRELMDPQDPFVTALRAGASSLPPGDSLVARQDRRLNGQEREAGRQELTSQVAVHLQRMPRFHRYGHALQQEDAESIQPEGSSAADDDDDLETAEAVDEASEAIPGVHRQSKARRQPQETNGGRGSRASDEGLFETGGSTVRRGKDGSRLLSGTLRRQTRSHGSRNSTSGKVALRDLDPHLDPSEYSLPTQRLHSNWPDGLKRQIARHFYGMTHAQILAEEERERLRDHQRRRSGAFKDGGTEGSADGGEEPGTVVGAATSSAATPQGTTGGDKLGAPPVVATDHRIPTTRSMTEGSGGRAAPRSSIDVMAHGIEIRIPNSDRPGVRAVVGRHTQRIHRRQEESAARPCMLLDKLHAERKRLSMKF